MLKADDKLGRQRPQETAALLATMDLRLEAARRQRLTLDRWALGVGAMRAYVRKARPSIDALLGDAAVARADSLARRPVGAHAAPG